MQIYTVLALLSVVIAVSAVPNEDYGKKDYGKKDYGVGYEKPAYGHHEGYGGGYGDKPEYPVESSSSSSSSSSSTEVIVIPSLPDAPECRKLHGCKNFRSETREWFAKHIRHLAGKLKCKWRHFISGLVEFKHAIGHDIHATFKSIHCTERQFRYWWRHYWDLCHIKREGRLHYQAEFHAWFELLIKNDRLGYKKRKAEYKLEADYAGEVCDEHGTCSPPEPSCESSSEHCVTPCKDATYEDATCKERY